MGRAVLDTSVLIAFLDDKDVHHGRALRVIEASVGRQQLVAPVLAYAEVMLGLQIAILAVRGAVQLFFETSTRVEPMTKAIGRRAAEIRG
ncbi:MAG: PIN domain-containing protein [Actinomycetota bacterium]